MSMLRVVGVLVLALVQLATSSDVLCKGGRLSVRVTLNTGDSFSFSTEGDKYADKQRCTANYKMGTCEKAEVSCETFETVSDSRCRRGDYLMVKNGRKTNRYCGQNGPDLELTSNFGLQFVSDRRRNAAGLKCQVTCPAESSTTTVAGPPASTTSPAPVTDVVCTKGTSDSKVMLNMGKTYSFSTDGRQYSPNQHCVGTYTLGSACSEATITCPKFSTRSNRKCNKGDYLVIAQSSKAERFCQRRGPKKFVVKDNFNMIFHSDARGSASGVDCKITCSSLSTGTPGTSPTPVTLPPPSVTATGASTTVPSNITFTIATVPPTKPPSNTTFTIATVPPTTAKPTTTGSGGPTSGDCKCGLAQRTQRIVGGEVTEVNEYPWQAGMVFSGDSTPWCGATVISDRWVLTAQHCTEGQAASSLEVLLGEHDTTSTSETTMVRKSIKRIVNHPSYNPTALDWDFALMELDSAIDFEANSHIRPVCMPAVTTNDYSGKDAIVTGWGTTSSGGSVSAQLREVTVQVMTNAQCKNTNYASSEITDRMVCAGVDGGGKDSCQGDSGGPLVSSSGGDGVTPGQNYDLIGVVSWGQGCALNNYPGVYARVTEAMTWINSYTSGSSTCPRQ